MIEYFFEDIDQIQIESTIKEWLIQLIKSEGFKVGQVNYIFCNDEYLLKVNRDFLNHDYYTDVITFDYVKGKTVSGDIFVSLPRISENAEQLGSSFVTELKRVLAHGILHLCGYKDKTTQEAAEMRNKEEFYLALI
ncbi:rRNA maturation RNase YbeY [Chryseobacterium sp. cx-311]|uniref:rRNA maturation RNase YbeY n=1 Tax=Marnyiella aurantia TaxID=2758037 RepID=UPI001AE4BA8C|nr:rRNA maturation RNase YbeY [Marnyiella aurantia]MBP0612298.1 rRNA maturation RNase YbeY [Marnyiella aurantia]